MYANSAPSACPSVSWCVPADQDITRPYPTIVELGAGAGHLRKYIGQRPGLERLIMCDTSGTHALTGIAAQSRPPSRQGLSLCVCC